MAAAAVGADKKGGKRRLAPAVMIALLGASLLAACAPLGPQTVEPIVEQANTTEAGATIPTYAELVAKAMGGGFDPESLEPGKAAALEQLRQTFFVREYDTDGDQQLDGPILSELGENTVQWAVDGVTPYLAGKAINEVYGGGTDTALLVSGFRPGEPLVVSVAGANAELVNQGVPANGAHLVVMSSSQAVVTDERSNPVAEVGADGVWRAMEVMVTEVPTETPEPTAEPTSEPEVGMQNEQGQWWDGAGWQSLPEGEGWQVEVLEDGKVQATDAGGEVYSYVGGEWLSKAQVESRRVAEYVEANTEPINRVEMPLLEFRASDRLQEAIWERLPDDVQALGDKPLYMIVPDPERLQAVIDGFSIHVVGQENKVSLAGRNVEFVFLSADEDTFTLPYYLGGGGSDAYRYGAFEAEDGTVQIVIRMARYVSTFYTYDANAMEWQMFSEGVMVGLQVLAEGQLSIFTPHKVSSFQRRFFYDSKYDDNNPGQAKDETGMLDLYVVQPRRSASGDINANSNYFVDHAEWLPDAYRDLVLNLNW